MTATPKWLKPVGIVALIWNLIGVAAFVMDLRLTSADVAKLSAAQQAMYAREKKCGQMWKADSAAHRVPAGQKWPQYWSACNKRLK